MGASHAAHKPPHSYASRAEPPPLSSPGVPGEEEIQSGAKSKFIPYNWFFLRAALSHVRQVN